MWIALLGDSGTGKTTYLENITERGSVFHITTNNERIQTVLHEYSNGHLPREEYDMYWIFYDITNEESAEVARIMAYTVPNSLVIANKIDILERRSYAISGSLPISARTGYNWSLPFELTYGCRIAE